MKKLKDRKVVKFLKDKGPGILGNALDIAGEVTGIEALESIGERIKGDDSMSAEDKVKALDLLKEDIKAYELEVKDRDSARKLYVSDSLAQKILAIVFTVAYFAVTYVLLNHFFADEKNLEDYELGFLSTLFGAMSAKVNTIIDFFFGGSMKKND